MRKRYHDRAGRAKRNPLFEPELSRLDQVITGPQGRRGETDRPRQQGTSSPVHREGRPCPSSPPTAAVGCCSRLLPLSLPVPVVPAVGGVPRRRRRRMVVVGPRVPVPRRRGRPPSPIVPWRRGRAPGPVVMRRWRRAPGAPGVVVKMDEQPAEIGPHKNIIPGLCRPRLCGHGREQKRDQRAQCQCPCFHDRSPCAFLEWVWYPFSGVAPICECCRLLSIDPARRHDFFPGCAGVLGKAADDSASCHCSVHGCPLRVKVDANGRCRSFACTLGRFFGRVSGHRAVCPPTWGHVGFMSG